MGLDMFVYRSDDETIDKLVEAHNKSEKAAIDEFYHRDHNYDELMYWRKANCIHRYLCKVGTEMIKDEVYIITKKQLVELLELCKKVQNNISKYGPELLPTQDGFFFGSTEYDDSYQYDLELTIQLIEENIIPSYDNEDQRYIYYASW